MARTKVFYFIPNLQQGGPEGQILALINRLPARFQPVLCVYHADDIFFDARCPPGQPEYALGVRKMNAAAFRRLKEILLAEKPAIVHSYRDKSNFWARLAAAQAGVPVTITACRNRMMELRYLLTERFMSRFSRLILTNSEGVRYELTQWAGVRDDKIRTIYNILDVQHFRPPTTEERAAARAHWELAPGALALLLPGRVGLQKHQIGLLLAMRRLLRLGLWPQNAVVLLAGRERDRGASWLVRRLAARPDVARHVRFLGAEKDIRSLYWASDVLVMPSLYEGLANAALEGVACGLPALLSQAANVDGIVRPNATGWEIPTGNQAALVAALADVVAAPPDRLGAMGQAGRAHVVARFAPHEGYIVDQMVAVYDELLAEAGAPC